MAFALLFGPFLTVAYVYFADRYCPANFGEHASLELWNNRSDNEHQTRYASTTKSQAEYGGDKHLSALLHLTAAEDEQEERQKQAAAKEKKPHGWIVKFLCEAKAADAALILFTYGLMVATIWLAWVTLRLWKAADEDTRFANRAWVFAGPSQIRQVKESLSLTGHVLNYGKSPATILETCICFTGDHPKGTPDYSIGSASSAQFTLAPNNDIHEIANFITPVNKPFMYGFVTYRDAFGDEHISGFCCRLSSRGDGWRGVGVGNSDWNYFRTTKSHKDS